MKILNTLKVWIQAYLNALWLSLRKTKTRIAVAITSLIASVPIGFCADTTTQMTEIVMAWMPLVILFAMLGMVLGLLKKFGKF